MQQEPTRRAFTKTAIHSLLTFSLIDTLCRNDLFADEIKPVTVRWLNEVNQLGKDLKGRKLKEVEWQEQVEKLLKRVELGDLLRLIDFDRLTERAKLLDRGARGLRFQFRDLDGVPTVLSFGKQVFGVKKGRSVVPHGYDNMATAFLILKGEFQGRHYDRVEDEEKHYIIKPTIDRKFVPGECSTVSDFKDNVHWFKSLKEPAYIFNIHIVGLKIKKNRRSGRVYLDPAGEKLDGGLIRAPRISYKEANERYG